MRNKGARKRMRLTKQESPVLTKASPLTEEQLEPITDDQLCPYPLGG